MKRKQYKSAIMQIFHYFIYYKIFELAMSLLILAIVYKLFPQPFHFFYNIILQHIN